MVYVRRFSLAAALVRLGFVLAVLLIVGATARAASAQSLAVPAYFYPGQYWTQLDQADQASVWP